MDGLLELQYSERHSPGRAPHPANDELLRESALRALWTDRPLAVRDAARLMPHHLGFITFQVDGRIVVLSPTLVRAIGAPPDGTRRRLDQLRAAPATGEGASLSA